PVPAVPPLPPALLSFPPPFPPEISTLSLHDALPICGDHHAVRHLGRDQAAPDPAQIVAVRQVQPAVLAERGDEMRPPDVEGERRSEEHTSELQSRFDLVCRLLLEKKKKKTTTHPQII